jgi:hypothetical protein
MSLERYLHKVGKSEKWSYFFLSSEEMLKLSCLNWSPCIVNNIEVLAQSEYSVNSQTHEWRVPFWDLVHMFTTFMYLVMYNYRPLSQLFINSEACLYVCEFWVYLIPDKMYIFITFLLYLSENLFHEMNYLFCHRCFLIFSLFNVKADLISHFDHYVKKEYFKPFIMVKLIGFAVL